MPKRIQRKRTAGYRLPGGAISIARPSRYGNPFRVISSGVVGMDWPEVKEWDCGIGGMPDPAYLYSSSSDREFAVERAVDLYRILLTVRRRDWDPERWEKWIQGARGRDLACFCPIGAPCHGIPLLGFANA